MGELVIKRTIAAAEYKEAVDKAQAVLDKVKGPADKQYETLESEIKAFAAAHKADFIGKTRTRKLSFGTVSWKLTNGKVQFNLAEDMVIMNLREQGHEDCIRTVEEVNKDVVQNLGENELLKAGITIKRADNCTIKPDIKKIQEEVAA
jgi:phage host-nuclease inhibitor protein Gam